jgi:predicted aspartyl protease
MKGIISSDREALIKLSIQRTDGQWVEVKVAIDTGFNDYLT